MINNFESWFNKTNKSIIKEDAAVTPEVSDKTAAASGRKGMMHDVDTIMTSLDALSVELTEELEAIEDDLVISEAGASDATDFIKSWITSMRATKAQKKVNKIKMNAADLEFASKNFEGDKKEKTKAKSTQVNQQAKDLQTMVNDKFKGKGAIVDAKLSKAKIEGQIEIIKRTSGMEDNPNKKSDMKTKLKELSNKYKEETAAINGLEDSNDEAIKAEKKRQQDKLDAEKAEGEPAKKVEGEPAKKVEGEPAKEPVKDETEEEKKARLAKAAAANKVDDSVQIDNDLITRAKNLNLNELAEDIATYDAWQIKEGTALYNKYNNIITKSEKTSILNEGFYDSVQDKFRRLM
tara:strand:- start:559 stop:1608 length:1050 start_codon:yes stop_codon:yes gene_type:complete